MQQLAPPFILSRLSVLFFLQFFIWGAWYVTGARYMSTHEMARDAYWLYTAGPLAAIIAPFFLGLCVDRFFNAEKVLATCFLLGGAIMGDDDQMRPCARQRDIEVADGEQCAETGKIAQNNDVGLKPFETARGGDEDAHAITPSAGFIDQWNTVNGSDVSQGTLGLARGTQYRDLA